MIHINGLFLGELTPNVRIGGCIHVYEQVFPDPYGVISAIEKQCVDSDSIVKFTKAKTTDQGIEQQHRTNYFLDITHASKSGDIICQNINNQVYTTLLSTASTYIKELGIQEALYHENYQMLKYTKDTRYQKHYDGDTSLGRAISAVIYLNDDYEGGEIEFPNFNIKLKPEAGMVILFPSNFAYAHIAHPVTKGIKYAIVAWVHDRPVQ